MPYGSAGELRTHIILDAPSVPRTFQLSSSPGVSSKTEPPSTSMRKIVKRDFFIEWQAIYVLPCIFKKGR